MEEDGNKDGRKIIPQCLYRKDFILLGGGAFKCCEFLEGYQIPIFNFL